MSGECPMVRVTGMLVEEGKLLVVEEVLRERSRWNLPGGKVELGERVGTALVREMREETGLEVEVCDLLYVTDRIKTLGHQIVDLCFSVARVAGTLPQGQVKGADGETLRAVRMVAVDDLPLYGFDAKFVNLVRAGFPGKGSYQGDFHKLYG